MDYREWNNKWDTIEVVRLEYSGQESIRGILDRYFDCLMGTEVLIIRFPKINYLLII